jgi:hypothetical protein
MTATIEPVHTSDSDEAKGGVALTASLVISGVGILATVIAWVWANAQQVDFDDLDLTGVFSGQEKGFAYFAVYLTASFLAGLVALGLAFVGAATERLRASVAAGAMAMVLVMVPVVFVVGHEVNHWGGCFSCGGYGGD